jgi:hypothetical protein
MSCPIAVSAARTCIADRRLERDLHPVKCRKRADIDRLLHIHPEHEHVQQHLHVPLCLHAPPITPEAHVRCFDARSPLA